MNNEIKEILDEMLWQFEKYPNDDFIIKNKESRILLDYITNLEQVNKNQAKRNSRQRLANTKQQELILKLQQENEHLRTDLNTFKNTIIEVNKECNSLFNHLTKKDLDYKSRCEKAIDYINNNFDKTGVNISGTDLPYSYIEDLLNILQNGSEDNEC